MRWNWANVIIPFVGIFYFGLLDNLRSAFFPEFLKDLNLNNTQGSYFFVIPALFAVLGSQSVPHISRFISHLYIWRIGLFMMGSSVCIFLLTSSYFFLGVALACFGFGFGFLQVAQYILLRSGIPERSVRKFFSGLQASYAFAALTAPILANTLLQRGWSWREGFFISGICALLAFFWSFFWQFSEDPYDQRQSQKDIESVTVPLRQFLYVALMTGFYLAAELTLVTRLVLYVQVYHEFSPEISQYFLFTFFVGIFFSRLLFTWYPFPRIPSRTILICFLTLSFTAMALGLFVSPYLLILCGFFMAPISGVFMNYLSLKYKQFGSHALSYGMGLGSLGVVFAHYIVGRLTDMYGIHQALHLVLFFLFTAALLILGHDLLFRDIFQKIKQNS